MKKLKKYKNIFFYSIFYRQICMSLAIERLQQERKRWRQDHPKGFIARPRKLADGTLDLFNWDCLIPGKEGSIWHGGFYPLTLIFPETYPANAPLAKFVPPVPHVNVFPSGTVCLSILHDDDGWKPSITLRQILIGIQSLLDNPNPESPAHQEHYNNYVLKRNIYDKNIIEHTKRFTKETLD